MPDLFRNKIFTNTLFLIILAELLSFLGYYYPLVNFLAFFIIVILTISVALYRPEYGLYILLTELLVGSFGYLFYFATGGFQVSIRVALWLIITSVWLAQTIIKLIKAKKIELEFFRSAYSPYFLILLIFIGWGLINGLLNGNSLNNIFFDSNNWLYFLLIFPIFTILQDNDRLEIIKPIFLAATTWLSAKTIILAYVFTHNFHGLNLEIYGWMRADRLGEITQTAAGFSRIFMQSHIFVLIGFFILLFCLLKLVIVVVTDNNRSCHSGRSLSRTLIRDAGIQGQEAMTWLSLISGSRVNPGTTLAIYLLPLTLFLSAIIISFSRSFWLGLAAGGLFVWLVALFKLKIKFKQFVIYNSIILFSIILSLILTVAAIKFPYPRAYGGFNPADLLGQRVTQITNEAGAASRWQLLPPLWQKIKTAPVLGRGFGATVTYKTSDPRVLAERPDGLYTTYSFEWGWLDIWLKLGLFGLLAYLFLLFKIIKDGLRFAPFNKGGEGDLMSLSLIAGLVVLMAVNIFSPYINHPLGIGYLIMAVAIMKNMNSKE